MNAEREAIPSDAYSLALEVGGVGVWVWDVDADRASWSPGWTSLLGYAHDELAGDLGGSVDLVHPDDEPSVRHELEELLTNGGERHLEYRLRHRDGGYRWVRGSGRASPDADGRGRIILAVIDVTEAHLAAERAEERRQLDALVRSSVARLVHIPPGKVGSAIREAMADVAGFLGADHAGLLLADGQSAGLRISERWDREWSQPIVPPPFGELPWWDRQVAASDIVRINDLADFPEEAEAEARFLAALGFRAVLIVPVSNDDGVTGVLVFASDDPTDWSPAAGPLVHALASSCCQAIARRGLEEQLQENLRRLEHVIESGPIVMWHGPGGGLSLDWMSPNTERLFGYEPDWFAANWVDLLHPDDSEQALAAIDRGLERGESQYVARFRHADGSWGVWQVFLRVDFDDTGAPSARNGYGLEITERQAAEERLRQAQRLEALGQLAGAVAHDFNNILAVIYGYVDLAQQRQRSEELQEALHAAERAKELVGQLLAFSRHHPVETTRLDVNAAVRSICSMLTPLLGRDIEVVTDLRADRPVTVAAVQLDQILMNLMLNARDAMADGGTLRIATDVVRRPADGPADHDVQLSVTDTGVGMTDDVAARAFDPFFTTKAGTGTGLGLATVYGTVASLGGSVSIDSTPQRGTRVTVLLPAADGATAEPEQVDAEQQGPGAVVLAVDDQAQVLEVTRRALELAGHTVLAATDGEAALELAATHPIELVITDVSMPGMNGPELVAALRVHRPRLRAMYMSGFSDAALSLDDASVFLQKPFSIKELNDRVADALRA